MYKKGCVSKPLQTKSSIIKKYPKGIKKLEIGSGEYPEAGYVHLDIQATKDLDIMADVRKMPLPDNFVTSEIRAVHIMEHFCHPKYSSQEMQEHIGTTLEVLTEIYRVLKPGARLIIVTPDFEKITQTAAAKKIPLDWLQRWSVGGHLNEFDVHHWLWTKENAIDWFSEVGFTDLKDWNPVKTWKEKLFLNWTAPEVGENPDWYRTEWYHWLFFEGTKPKN